MKKFLLQFFAFIISATVGEAQITIYSSDLSLAGDMIRVSNSTPFTGMDATLTGTNYTWNFSQLLQTQTGQMVDTFLSISQTSTIFNIVFYDASFNSNRANQATPGSGFSFSTVLSVSGVFNFYYNGPAYFDQPGFGATINSIPAPISFSPHDVLYRFPLDYGSTDSTYSAYSISIPSLGSYSVMKNRIDTVDGWGMLTTPYGTFSTLRVKSVLHEHDSIHYDSLGFGLGINVPERIEYKWMGTGQHIPLLQINTANGNVTQITYRDSLRSIGFADLQKVNFDFSAYPNPVSDKFFISYELKKSSEVTINILNLAGEKITSLTNEKQTAGKHFLFVDSKSKQLSAGNYFVKMTADGNVLMKKIIIE